VTARTPSAVAALPIARRSGSVLSAIAVALLVGGVALASPAAAVDDPAVPDARVTHGPSCHPGGVVVEVTGGTVPWSVTLATTRLPQGEDTAEVPAGGTVVLRTGDVAWGETIDGRLEYAALDGSGDAFADELEGYTFTRPAQEDCAAIAAPAAAATVPSVGPAPDGPETVPDDAVEAAATAVDDGAEAEPDAGTADVRPDGTRPGGTDAAEVPLQPAPGKVDLPGTASQVDLVEAAAVPESLAPPGSRAPLVAAAVALGAAAAGLLLVSVRSRRAGRPPTRSA
jgi:hypothetical protein